MKIKTCENCNTAYDGSDGDYLCRDCYQETPDECSECGADFNDVAAEHGLDGQLMKAVGNNRYVCLDCDFEVYDVIQAAEGYCHEEAK